MIQTSRIAVLVSSPEEGRSKQLLDTFLEALKLNDCTFINPRKRDELQALKGKRVFFLLGEQVVKACFRKMPGKLSEIEGKIYWDRKHDIYCIPLALPSSWIRHRKQRIKVFKKLIPRLMHSLQVILSQN